MVLGTDSNAMVAHAEEDAALPLGRLLLADLEGDGGARRRVLDGVAQQVDEHLADAQGVAVDPAVPKPGIHLERLGLLGKLGVEHGVQVLDELAQVEVVHDQAHLAALDPRHVEDVVEKPQQVVRGRLHLAQAVDAHLGGLALLQGYLGHADDAVHGGADLVRHARQELRLGTGRLVVALEVEAVLDDGGELRERRAAVIGQVGVVEALEEDGVGVTAVVRHGYRERAGVA